MKIATYNVRNLYDPGTFIAEDILEPVQEGFFNQRIAYFTEQLRSLDIDIICLQEIGGEKGVITLADTLSYNYFFAKPNKRGIRMAVMYKKMLPYSFNAESISLGELHVPSIQLAGDTTNLPPVNQRRDVLTLDVDGYDGKKLRIVTFHLKSLLPTYLEGDNTETDPKAHTEAKFRSIFYKMLELQGLRAYADKAFNEGREVIFLGDFNENHNSSSIDILKSSNQEERMLYDVLVGYEGVKTTHIHRGNALTFDTILVSQGIKEKIASVAIENRELKDYSILPRGEIEFEIQSDHAMVILELS